MMLSLNCLKHIRIRDCALWFRNTISTRLFTSAELPSYASPCAAAPIDKLLFTPGPLTTSHSVKEAALHDMGSRDGAFIEIVNNIRNRLLELARVSKSDFTSIPIQGSGTFAVEATLTSVLPKDGFSKMMIIDNGAYGSRMQTMAIVHQMPHLTLRYAENTVPSPEDVDRELKSDRSISHVAMVHSETTSGILNPIESIGSVVRDHKRSFIVDAMSSFGGVPIDFEACGIDYLVSSANKCIEGIPGFAFLIANRDQLAATKGNARTVSLDIHAQEQGLESNGQFRFTPPTQAILAFHQALIELIDIEGGVEQRFARYRELQQILLDGIACEDGKSGFQVYIESESLRGPTITSFRYPKSSNWNFNAFYKGLSDRDKLIYPGKVSNADCFRIGHIGRLFPDDMRALVADIHQVAKEMKLFTNT